MEKCRNWPTDQGLRRQEGKEARLEKGGDYKDSYPDWREVMVLVETLEEHAEHGDLSYVALPPPPLLPGQPHTSGSSKGAHAPMLV